MYLGVYPRTGEHIIALETGEAIRVRTVHRLAEGDRWNMDAIMSIKALPRIANPNTGEESQRHGSPKNAPVKRTTVKMEQTSAPWMSVTPQHSHGRCGSQADC